MATIVLAFVTHRLYFATQQLSEVSREMNSIAQTNAKAQTDALLINALNSQNMLVLSEDQNLRIADHLISHDNFDQTDEAARERWMTFVLLNVQ
ncbi:hypothetical protein [Anthocerotibacter panamensis]|uniref:hypothetical protein n=1 Tax=Anthocerotibacter panamensis TaxID=2857077 RepID=UPI001C406B75|nr:hypothetical protein [Anthocerotibacter panamensis]